jgi:ubiquinol-cytochrome c reductase cytochrome c1 subunit
MAKLRTLLAGAFAATLLAAPLVAAPAFAQEEVQLPNERWSFQNPFGTFDLAAAQRGLQVYGQVCSNCHSLKFLHYRDLAGIGLNEEQIKAFAAQFTVPDGTDDQGQPKEGPATPAAQFRSPFPNEKAARGYEQPPAGFKLQEGLNYNKVFPGHQIAMPQPLQEGTVEYTDGTKSTLDQEAHDVVTFLAWAANPEMVERKQIGVRIVLFLVFMTGLTYAVKRKVWSNVEH